MGETKRPILGMGIEKASGSDPEGIILEPINYEGESTLLKFRTEGRDDEMAR